MIASIVYIVLVVGGLLYLIKKKRDTEAKFPLKIIGYYILGVFAFKFNGIALPLGFIIYLLFFRPKVNADIKRQAAIFGLIIFIIVQWITPITVYMWESRTITIEHELESAFTIDFAEENELITKKLKLDENRVIKLENFSLDYGKDGKLTDLSWVLIQRKNAEFFYYDIYYEVEKKRYQITQSHIDSIEDTLSFVDADYFFEKMNTLDIQDITNTKGDFSKYAINSFGNISEYGVMDNNPHLITDGEVNLLREEQLPVYGYRISTYALEKRKEERDEDGDLLQGFEGTKHVDYLFDSRPIEEEMDL
ncbi:hypothetical protein AB9M62_55860 [Bacillales bacterium AN1005]